MAFDKNTADFYAATTLKRHIGIKDSPGTIYRIGSELDETTREPVSAPTILIDLNTAPVPLGFPAVSAGAATDLGARGIAGPNEPSQDPLAYTRIGRYALGDIDISPDGSELYVVNTYDGPTGTGSPQLITVDLTANPVAISSVVNINATTTGVVCGTGNLRPWGLGVNKTDGTVYLGAVCSGENSASVTDMTGVRGYMLEFNATLGTFTSQFD